MADSAAFIRIGPSMPVTPLVIAVPHAGRDYPPALLAAARLPRERLESLEDRLADRLPALMAARGATIFVAQRARAWIDLNRDPGELDPGMLTPPPPPAILSRRVRHGLGLVPRRIANGGEIYARPLALADVQARIAEDHMPWHAALADALVAAHARFGVAVLLDCHSMPPLEGRDAARVVLGDRFGRSAGAGIVAAARGVLMEAGVRSALNTPYAGGYAVERHGRPERGIHALQIEFCRSLYLDGTAQLAGDGMAHTQQLFAALAVALASEAMPGLMAAE